MEKQRLDKYLSGQITDLSRKDARAAIRGGRVKLSGETVRDPAVLIDAEEEKVTLDGQAVGYKKSVYIVMNKPAGVLSAASDESRRTVVDLVPEELRRSAIAPVGRLDRDTTGLLIITDDGALAHRCISPKYKLPKTYLAELDGDFGNKEIEAFRCGITLADGTKCRPALLERAAENTARITVTEGKYHQIKRMFGVVGLGVNALHREAIGGLSLPENLGCGECLELTRGELISALEAYNVHFKQNNIYNIGENHYSNCRNDLL